jgi:signal transduction histidine kinase
MGKIKQNNDQLKNRTCFFQELDTEFLIHEMKDPLAIIETGVRTLLERQNKYGALTPKQDKTLKRILRNTRKARGMIYSLLEIGRSESGGFTLCEFQPAEATYEALVDALEAMVGEVPEPNSRFEATPATDKFLNDQQIFLDFSPDALQCQVYQDRVKFCQIAGNLIKNALHHRKARLDIRLRRQSGSIVMEVIDDGPGIDAAHHREVFQRYRQLNATSSLSRKGHGLGLAGARVLARFMGGDVRLDSQRGQGATFKLILPVKMDTPPVPTAE